MASPELIQKREELYLAVSRAGVGEAIVEGRFDALCTELGYVNKTGVTAYTVSEADANKLLIFNQATVTLTLPATIEAESDKTVTIMAVNTVGKIVLAGATPVSVANQVDAKAMAGIVYAGGTWVVTGTSVGAA
jgi:hypothetical protein